MIDTMLKLKLYFWIFLLHLVRSGFAVKGVKGMKAVLSTKHEISSKYLKEIINGKHSVTEDDKKNSTIFSITIHYPPIETISIYFDLMQELKNQLEKPPVAVNFIRSLRYCNGVPELGIPPLVSGDKSPPGFLLVCEQHGTLGAYWNQTQL